MFGNVSAASITNFFPTVVATLNYSKVKTLLLTAPPYVLGVLTMLLNAWHADRTGERFWHVSLPLCLAMATFILAASTTNVAARYVAMMLMVSPGPPSPVPPPTDTTPNRFPASTAATPQPWPGSATRCPGLRPSGPRRLASSTPCPTRRPFTRAICIRKTPRRSTRRRSYTTASWRPCLLSRRACCGRCWRG